MPPPPWISHPESKPLPSPSPLSASSSLLRRVDGSTPRNPPTDRSETPSSNSNTPQSASPFPTPSRGTHTRSSSHPFPLLFGSGRRRERQAAREHLKADGLPHHGRTSRSFSPRKNALSANEDYVSRRCMTCDHTNSFPHGRKGFRCGKCTAMNDLEPCIEPSNAPLSNSESPFGPQLRRKGRFCSLLPPLFTSINVLG